MAFKFPGLISSLFDKPWRDIPWGNRRQEHDYVENYKPHSEAQHIRVLLHGAPGAGKSSFINSVDSALRGKITVRALTATAYGDSFTQEYRGFKIQKGTPGNYYPVVFCDTKGVERGSVDVKMMKQVMEGQIKDGFKPSTVLTESNKNPNPTINDMVHVVLYVISANTPNLTDNKHVLEMKAIRETARDLRIPQIAILTKIEEACPKVKKDIRNAYRSKTLRTRMEELSVTLGIPMNCIFLVQNYSIENKTNEDIDTLILNFIRMIIDFGEDFLNDIAQRKQTSHSSKGPSTQSSTHESRPETDESPFYRWFFSELRKGNEPFVHSHSLQDAHRRFRVVVSDSD